MQDDIYAEPPSAVTRQRSDRSSTTQFTIVALLVALLLGGAAALWIGHRAGYVTFTTRTPMTSAAPAGQPQPVAAQPASIPAEQVQDATQVALGVRMAELEQRMTQLNLQADAAQGNAARAEGLLIAFAARRAIERGTPLGYLEDQLKLRFGNAQPNAVQTLTEVAASPVTLDMLTQGLDALAPTITHAPASADLFQRVRREVANLFVVRRVGTPSPAPERRIDRARMFLDTGRVDAAIGEVERLPGRAAAENWIVMARRYVRAQRALDLIETAAILEPRTLRDEAGARVSAPSPIAAPTGAVPPASAAEATF